MEDAAVDAVSANSDYFDEKAIDNILTQNYLDAANISEARVKELESQLKELRDAKTAQEVKLAEADARLQATDDVFRSKLAETLGIDKPKVDAAIINGFEFFNDWDPAIQDWFSNVLYDVVDGVEQVQKSFGEDGKSLAESVRTKSWLERKIQGGIDYINESWGSSKMRFSLTAFFLMAPIISLAIGLGWSGSKDAWEWAKKNSGNASTSATSGCYQFNSKTGSIKFLGVCGVAEKCSVAQNATDCKAMTPKNICSWDGNKCIPGPLVMNSSNCCPGCKKTSDCNTVSSQKCTTDSQCWSGKCNMKCPDGNGMCCSDQTCDSNTGSCTPCPSLDPAFPIYKQFTEGKLGFCSSSLGSSTCGAASLICNARPTTSGGAGGACTACEPDDSFCTSTLGNDDYVGSCICTGSDWITMSVCASPSALITNLAYMSAIKNQWVPQKTPLVIYIIVGIGAFMFFVTLLWYIRYLFNHAGK